MRAAILLFALLGVACSVERDPDAVAAADNGSESDVSIRVGGEGGGMQVKGGDTLSIDLPGFRANVDMPKIDIDPANLDLNGIDLYPGTKVTGVDIRDGQGGDTPGSVRLGFTSPDAPDRLIAYYSRAAEEQGYRVNVRGGALDGTNGEDALRVVAASDPGGGSRGQIVFSGR